ncbi:MAG: ferrochelatase [Candidatus Omnitrophica bacterium]|nr:ferrochelatase [Candidatus Omnitrophota bacterium]
MKIDVVLITYGEPETNSFLEQWSYSNRILFKLTRLVAPIPKAAVPLIGAWRGYGRRKTWREEGYASPLESITRRQAEFVQDALNARNDGNVWRVHVAFEFRHPSLTEVLKQIQNQSCDQLILAPMYLPISDFTTGISQRDYRQFQEKNNHPLPEARTVAFRACHREISHVMADYVRRELEKLGVTVEQRREYGLLLGCHGTVMTPPPGISDAGYCDTKQAYDNMEEELKPEFKSVAVGWLNHRLGGEWTSPTLQASVQTMLDQGIEHLIYFPFGFLADNAETQLEGRTILRDLGVEEYHHLPCMNDDPAFMHFLVERIVQESARENPGENA